MDRRYLARLAEAMITEAKQINPENALEVAVAELEKACCSDVDKERESYDRHSPGTS
ncbi:MULTISPECIES: hypothetical protein [unclassified Paenibacillus]|uniref:hypothetical protein n=1 Tax=unclassified Paenibacillus TaxID=185978 RepID=UPI0015A01484|nr:MULTISPECIES: hypothetical protein [unclassified Paenibacillus]